MELSEALGDSHVREIEEELDRALLLRFLVVGDEEGRRGLSMRPPSLGV